MDTTIIPTGGKGALERESIAAALCSEYLVALETIGRMLPQNVRKMMDTVVVLPEVLTVTCTRRDIDDGSGDGFQLRDLSRMDPTKMYFPPISIPFVDATAVGAKGIAVEFAKYAQPWSAIEKDGPKAGWGNFWSDAFKAWHFRGGSVLIPSSSALMGNGRRSRAN